MGKFNSDDHYIYYCGQESLRIKGEALTVNKRFQNAVLGCNLKNDRLILVHFQGKSFNITVIEFYAPTTNAEEAKVERFCEDLQDLLELTKKKKRCPFHHRELKSKSRKSRDTWSNRQVWLWCTNNAKQRLTEFCQENTQVIANNLFQQHKTCSLRAGKGNKIDCPLQLLEKNAGLLAFDISPLILNF